MNRFHFQAIFLFILTVSGFIPIDAQLNRIGGGLAFNTPISSPDLNLGNPGFNLRGVYEYNRKFFIIPSVTFQLPKTKDYTDIYGNVYEKLTLLASIDANVTYAIAIEKELLFYALVAPNFTNIYTNWDPETDEQKDKYQLCPGIGIGTGIEMIVEKNINAYAQIEYVLGKYQQLVIFIGIHYYFEGRIRRIW
jgi:hypothetical protein